MKKWLVALMILAMFCFASFAQAGAAKVRSLVSFVHLDEEIVIPENGAYLQFNEQNGIEYYRWTVKDKGEFCEDMDLPDVDKFFTKNNGDPKMRLLSNPSISLSIGKNKEITTSFVNLYITYTYLETIEGFKRVYTSGLTGLKWYITNGDYRVENPCTDAYAKCDGLESGEGTDLPDGVNLFSILCGEPRFDMGQCYNVDSDTMFFAKDVSIGYGTPGDVIPIEVLVYNACLNQTVQVKGAGHTFIPMESIQVKFRIYKINDKGPTGKRWLRLDTGWVTVPVNVDGTFEYEIEGGYTFIDDPVIKHDGTGAYLFDFRVLKPNGARGSTRSKVIVHDCQTPGDILPTILGPRGITR